MTRSARSKVNRLLMAALAATPLLACAAAGEFTFVIGDVSLTKTNGQRITPVRGTAVDPGDRVATGANGMAQLTMVDNARLSLRPATQFTIEAYPERRDSTDGAILNLVRGTLRTFTGLIASTNRDKFVMKTRVATVGIRGSGNILYACEGQECDDSISPEARAQGGVTVNHTIEGAHATTNILARAGVPAQQGGAETVITGPGQTVLVAGAQPPRFIPTPSFIAGAAINMTQAKAADTAATLNSAAAAILGSAQSNTAAVVGNNGLGFVIDVDATGNLLSDQSGLRDIIIVGGSPFSGQATRRDIVLEGNDLRGYTAYAGSQSGVAPSIAGGSRFQSTSIPIEGGNITFGRYESAALGYFGPGTETSLPGDIHWIMGPSGFPLYLSDVLTGTATYTLAGNSSPTNQTGATGALNSARIDMNFTSRTLGLQMAVTMPATSSTAPGNWQLTASNVPVSLNTFFGSTSDYLVITSGQTSSQTNPHLTGSFDGSFVGSGLTGAILGYGIQDQTGSSGNFVSGVAAFTGPRQDDTAAFREGRVSDSTGAFSDFIRGYATTDRPDEVTADAQGRVTAFSAPLSGLGAHASYAIGSATVVESGIDTETGLVWGRWGGGTATVTRAGQSQSINLTNSSLHYIFAGTQSGPVALPLSGTANYTVLGSTSPTDSSGRVGALNSASLNANFTDRTVDAAVNISIANQTWNGSASRMPIYRDQYFSAYSGTPIPGVPNPAPLTISCTPACAGSVTGSFDGFFTGRTGGRAGMMYNLGGNQGAIAFGRPGGG